MDELLFFRRTPKVYVLMARVGERLSNEQLECYLNQLPLALQNEILKYRKWKDIQGRLFGKLLLKIGLTKYFFLKSSILNEVRYTRRNRPYIPDVDLDFNISHSGDIVVCGIARGMSIGVDAEEIKPIALSDFRDQLSKRELTSIRKSRQPVSKFYSYWTKKEAVMKAEGYGLGVIPLQQVTFNEYENKANLFSKKWYLYNLELEKNYSGCIAIDQWVKKNLIASETISFQESTRISVTQPEKLELV